MNKVLGFDVYGTLIDTGAIAQPLYELMGDLAPLFAARWREKQLEYSFRRGLMQNYVDFSRCTEQALDYCCESMGQALTAGRRKLLMTAYGRLPAFDDVPQALTELRDAGCRLYAFSNGAASAVQTLLEHAGLEALFDGIVSAEPLRSYKPNPAVYAHFLRSANAEQEQSWLISANSFDVIGARSAGLQAVWLKRDTSALLDPWELAPTLTVSTLAALPGELAGQ